MNLRQRLALLTGAQAASAAPASTTRERLERLLGNGSRAQASRGASDEEVAACLGGVVAAPGVVLVEHVLPLGHVHGRVALARLLDAPLGALARSAPLPGDLLFLDTETTGLAGGTGTLPFLLGLARLEEQSLCLRQYLLTSFAGEMAMLVHARPWLEAGRHLVSYNGKSFDVPLLAARHRLRRLAFPLSGKPHLDLLHPTRAAFGSLWPDYRLQQAESQLLDLVRVGDLPGWQVPQVWTDFVRTGVLGAMSRVLQHNELDVITLAALLAELSRVHAEPGYGPADHHALARSRLRLGEPAQAMAHLQAGRDGLDTGGLLAMARLLRRQGDWDRAVSIWEGLAGEGVAEAMLALAKFHEHETKDFRRAVVACQALMARQPGEPALQHRWARITRKAESARSMLPYFPRAEE